MITTSRMHSGKLSAVVDVVPGHEGKLIFSTMGSYSGDECKFKCTASEQADGH